MKLWRIASTARTHAPDDLSGRGAAAHPGRWNDIGQHVVYASPNLALAVLETAAHIDDRGLPLNRYVVSIEIPVDLWKKRERLAADTLPAGWDAIPHGMVSIRAGGRWYDGARAVLLEVPSVIVPEESNVLINAVHPDAQRLVPKVLRRFDYNALFRR